MFYCEILPGLSISDIEYAKHNKNKYDVYISCNETEFTFQNCIYLNIPQIDSNNFDKRSYNYNKKIINSTLLKLKQQNIANIIEESLSKLKSILLFSNNGTQLPPTIIMYYLKHIHNISNIQSIFNILLSKSHDIFKMNNKYIIQYKDLVN